MNLLTIVNDAIDELREWRQDNPDDDEPHDKISEIADGSVPVYTCQLLRLAADNITLATDEPEMGPASGCNFDGSPSPVNIIAANVYEHVEQAILDAWHEFETADVEEEEDENDAA